MGKIIEVIGPEGAELVRLPQHQLGVLEQEKAAVARVILMRQLHHGNDGAVVSDLVDPWEDRCPSCDSTHTLGTTHGTVAWVMNGSGSPGLLSRHSCLRYLSSRR